MESKHPPQIPGKTATDQTSRDRDFFVQSGIVYLIIIYFYSLIIFYHK